MLRHYKFIEALSRVYIIPIILILTIVTGCSAFSTTNPTYTPLVPNSSSYPVEITGRVTVANTIVVNQKQTKPPQGEYWIVQASITNKEYQLPIKTDNMWTIEYLESGHFGQIGSSLSSRSFPSDITIPQGKSGQIILCFMITPLGINPNDCRICLAGYASKNGQIRDSYGKLKNKGIVAEIYDWDSQKILQVGKVVTPFTVPLGIYTANIGLGVPATLTFKSGNIIDINSDIGGRGVGRYTISSDSSRIIIVDLVTNDINTFSFKYVADAQCVVFNGVPFYK
jgi:hypothetical protein